jgi:hypothetical protein
MATAAELSLAKKTAPSAARDLFASDSRIFSVGVGWGGNRPVWRVIRNITKPRGSAQCLEEVGGFQVSYADVRAEPAFRANVAYSDPPGTSANAQPRRTLLCGVELQNYDYDDRQRKKSNGAPMQIRLGTLGCFVRLNDGDELALLSNAHVLCPHGDGNSGDLIYNCGCKTPTRFNEVASYRPVHNGLPVTWPGAQEPVDGSPAWNEADAALATLCDNIDHCQQLPTSRGLRTLKGCAEAMPGDKVYKCGQRTGYTEGVIDATDVFFKMAAPTANHWYWFRGGITITPEPGFPKFDDVGDSGAVAVRQSDDMAIGLNFAGGSGFTFANDMATVLKHLNCRLA